MFQKKYYRACFSVFILLAGAGCGNVNFKDVSKAENFSGTPSNPPGLSGSVKFDLAPMKFEHTQETYPQNDIAVSFQAFDTNGMTLNDLQKNQIVVTENGQRVNQFELGKQTVGLPRDVDFVVVLDVTSSMGPYIDLLKTRIGGFVSSLEKSNIKAHLCLVEVGETVEKECKKFYDTFDEFLKDVDAVVPHDGGSEPDENQLLGMEAATRAPWHDKTQRVALLISDAGFHYAPDNIGEGKNVPTYTHTYNMITAAKMQTFIVGPYKYGYMAPLQGLPAMTTGTDGQFYLIDDVLTGKTDMSDIFNSIITQLSTTYAIQYSIEDNNLDPALSLAQRNIQVQLTQSMSGTLKVFGATSTLPNGHPAANRQFLLSSQNIAANLVAVFVDHQKWPGAFQISGSSITFDTAPPAGSLIEVYFELANLRQNLNFSPMTIRLKNIANWNLLKITVNGHILNNSQFHLTILDATTATLDLSDALFDEKTDPLEILNKSGLVVQYSM